MRSKRRFLRDKLQQALVASMDKLASTVSNLASGLTGGTPVKDVSGAQPTASTNPTNTSSAITRTKDAATSDFNTKLITEIDTVEGVLNTFGGEQDSKDAIKALKNEAKAFIDKPPKTAQEIDAAADTFRARLRTIQFDIANISQLDNWDEYTPWQQWRVRLFKFFTYTGCLLGAYTAYSWIRSPGVNPSPIPSKLETLWYLVYGALFFPAILFFGAIFFFTNKFKPGITAPTPFLFNVQAESDVNIVNNKGLLLAIINIVVLASWVTITVLFSQIRSERKAKAVEATAANLKESSTTA